jgi:hypothetical protein
MINSRKIICMGEKILGYFHPSKSGNEAVRITGM